MTIAEQINVEALLELVMTRPWHSSCEIIQNYQPGEKAEPKTVIRYNDGTEHPPFLRNMPAGGTFMSSSSRVENELFWDVYGDDFQSPERALLALLQSPQPVDVNPQTFSLIPDKKKDE